MLAGTSRARDEVVGRCADRLPRVLGIHGREGRRQRRHGGRPARVPAGHPGRGGERHDGALELDDVVRHHRHRQRPDPQRDRHELGHRRLRPVQPRQRDDRPRLQPGLAEPAGRLGPGRDLHGLAGQLVRLQRRLRRERGAQPVDAVPRPARLRADRQHREPVPRRLVHAVRHHPRRHLAGALPRPARGVRPVHRADRRPRPARGQQARRVRLRHAREARRLAAPRARCARRASTGTTSGCRRSCARGPCWARSRTPPT